MNTVYRVVNKAVGIIKSRLFCVSALAVICSIIIVYVCFNMNAVTIVAGDTSRVVLTLDDNSQRILAHAGVTLKDGDEIVRTGNVMEVKEGCNVQVTADGISKIVCLTEGTVADVLERVGVTIDGDDEINVNLTESICDGMDINIDRIGTQQFTETQTIAYTSKTTYTNTISPGRSFIKQVGQNGEKTVTYSKTYKNGEVVKSEVVSETVTKQPVQEIKLVGMKTGTPLTTAPYDIELNANGQPVNYKTVYTGKATAYSSDRGYAGKGTASGRKAQVGVVAVDPKLIPYGTELYIVSPDGSYVYGYAIAGDTGSAMTSGAVLVDLFFDHYEECLKFGAKKLNVYVLN